MNFDLYKKTNDLPHLNEALATFIVTYCLNVMSNSDLKFDNWRVGISTGDKSDNEKYTSGECKSHLEALQTKQYLVDEKKMIDDNENIIGDETFIYVYRD